MRKAGGSSPSLPTGSPRRSGRREPGEPETPRGLEGRALPVGRTIRASNRIVRRGVLGRRRSPALAAVEDDDQAVAFVAEPAEHLVDVFRVREGSGQRALQLADHLADLLVQGVLLDRLVRSSRRLRPGDAPAAKSPERAGRIAWNSPPRRAIPPGPVLCRPERARILPLLPSAMASTSPANDRDPVAHVLATLRRRGRTIAGTRPMAGDVSRRRYVRLTLRGPATDPTAVLALYPSDLCDACERSVVTGRLLHEAGVRVPTVLDADAAATGAGGLGTARGPGRGDPLRPRRTVPGRRSSRSSRRPWTCCPGSPACRAAPSRSSTRRSTARSCSASSP